MPTLAPSWAVSRGAVRPVLIVQNDTGNRHSPTVIAAAITSQTGKARLPTHISLAALSCGLPKDSVILLEQIRTLDKRRLREHMGKLDETMMKQVDGGHCGELRPPSGDHGIAAAADKRERARPEGVSR